MTNWFSRVGMHVLVSLLVGLSLPAMGGLPPAVVFPDGTNVNVLNSWGTTCTASVNPTHAAYLLDGIYDETQWSGGTANGSQVTINLGKSQTVSGFRTYTYNGTGSEVTNVVLESSSDGATWTTVSGATYSLVGGNEAKITLSSPVTAKAFRITRADNSGITWRLSYIRAYGATGSLPAGNMNRDLIYTSTTYYNRSGYTGEDVIGAPYSDNPAPLADHRYITFHGINTNQPSPNWNQTWLQFRPNAGSALNMGGIGLTFIDGYLPAGDVHFQVHVSNAANNSEPDSPWTSGGVPNFTGSTLALDYSNTLTSAVNYLAFPNSVTGTYLRVDFLSIKNGSGTEIATRFGNIMIFEMIPPPAGMLITLR